MDQPAGANDPPPTTWVGRTLAEQTRLLDLSNDAIIVRDVHDRIIYWNHGATELYGWTREEAVGQHLHTLLRTEFELPLEQLIARLHQQDRMEGEVVQVTRDGRPITTFCRWALDHDAAGRPGAILTIYHDITARTRAEAPLRASEARFRAMFEQASVGIVQLTIDGQLLLPNPGFCHLIGYPFADVRQLTVRDITHPDDYAQEARLTRQLIAGEIPRFTIEKRYLHQDGRIVWGTMTGTRMQDVTDAQVYVLAIVHDITDRKSAEAALQESRAALEHQSRLFDTTLSTISDFAYLFDRAGRFVFANQPLLDLWGLSLEAAVGKTFAELGYPAALAARLQRQVSQVFATGQVVRDETPYTSPSGVPGYYEYIFTPLRGADGTVQGVVGSTRDTTKRRRVEEALRASEARFRAVANLVPDLLWSNDTAGRIEWSNQRWADYTGQTPEAVLGFGWIDVIHPEDRAVARRTFRRALDTGTALRQEQRIRRHDGTYRWFLVQAQPFSDEAGRTVRWYGAATDVHEERMALEEARAALQTRDQFLSIAAHELRTPMTSLIGYVYLLPTAAAQGSEQLARMTARITQQAQRLNILVNQLLDVSRLQRGQFALDRQRVDLAVVVAQVVDAFDATQSPTARQRISMRCPNESLPILGDAPRLEQVMVNLLSNAVKYSPAGGPIQVRLGHTATEGMVEVEDQGIGIPVEAQARLFEPFYRASTASTQASGFGIGLHIVREIVERHGGRIEVESTEGQGSTFRVVLPLLPSGTETM